MNRRLFISSLAAAVTIKRPSPCPNPLEVQVLTDGVWKRRVGGLLNVKAGEHFKTLIPEKFVKDMGDHGRLWLEGIAVTDGQHGIDSDGHSVGCVEADYLEWHPLNSLEPVSA